MAAVTGRIAGALRPLPVADDLTRPYWDAAREGRLAIQRCQACGTRHHPPLPFCDICDGRDLRFETVSGRATIYTYTVVHANGMPAFAGATPYAIVEVELAEQPGLLLTCNMDTTPLEDVRIGAPVEVDFLDIGDGMVLPDFRLAAAGA
ncbi:MAG TPA: OB-fold domain-containing protein [Candidatus Dormibacteraeota bacterium]|jgi:uncharacterized OB-fold protein|nr:OB-fold domain-containing protein [Candidatus Dormibacteraeota bacterium]